MLEFLKRINASREKSFSNPDSPFCLLKSDCIVTIGNLCFQAPKNQDLVAEFDGICILLDHCNIDDNFPFIKESSLFAIRNLTQGNLKNQEMIAKLKPIDFTESSKALMNDINLNQCGR